MSIINLSRLKRIALLIPVMVLAAFLISGLGGAKEDLSAHPSQSSTAKGSELKPTERQRKIARLVTDVIEKQHYRQTPLNSEMSQAMFEQFLETLDSSHSYLLASDIEEFKGLKEHFGQDIKAGDLDGAFKLFARYQLRNREAIEGAIKDVATEPNFEVDETLAFDRSHSPWLKDAKERDALWHARLKNDALSLLLTNKPWAETAEVLKKRYERVLKRIDQTSNDDVFETLLNTYAHVYDPHSNYLSPRSSAEYDMAMKLSYVGIGASLQLTDDYVTIINVIPGGPAAVSALVKANDRITAVGQGKQGPLVDVVGWRLDDVVQLIRGPEGSLVRLSILPAGATPGSKENHIEFVRHKVTLEAQAAQKKKTITIERNGTVLKVGVIDVPSFYQDFDAKVKGDADYRSTTKDVAKLISELKAEHIDALVMDLRGNGGGHLSEATGLVGLFIPHGPAVQLREASGKVEALPTPQDPPVWTGPLMVLVDRSSASATEIFSGAIQDYGRGLIVGQQTYGKGTVQNLYPLDRWTLGPGAGFGELTVTIGKYYRVTGDSVQNRGVMPDIALPSLISTLDVGESTKDHALPWDQIRGASFTRMSGPQAWLDVIEANHQARMQSVVDLKVLADEVQEFEQLRKQKTVSLKLSERKLERDRLDKERLAHLNTIRAAHKLPAFNSLEDIKPDDVIDATLNESAEMAVDWVELLRHPPEHHSVAAVRP